MPPAKRRDDVRELLVSAPQPWHNLGSGKTQSALHARVSPPKHVSADLPNSVGIPPPLSKRVEQGHLRGLDPIDRIASLPAINPVSQPHSPPQP